MFFLFRANISIIILRFFQERQVFITTTNKPTANGTANIKNYPLFNVVDEILYCQRKNIPVI